jgi:hypothetical protein
MASALLIGILGGTLSLIGAVLVKVAKDNLVTLIKKSRANR